MAVSGWEKTDSRETGNREVCCGSASGRAVIAMTAVRIRTLIEPGKVAALYGIRPPKDVMAITSLPNPSQSSGLPFSVQPA